MVRTGSKSVMLALLLIYFLGKQIAFSARVLGKSAAWNTNLDIFIVPTDGDSRPKAISSKNKGADTHPVYSPDGEYLAWLQMAV